MDRHSCPRSCRLRTRDTNEPMQSRHVRRRMQESPAGEVPQRKLCKAKRGHQKAVFLLWLKVETSENNVIIVL